MNLTVQNISNEHFFKVIYNTNVIMGEPRLLNWYVSEFTDTGMKIQLELSDKLAVSTGEGLDNVYF